MTLELLVFAALTLAVAAGLVYPLVRSRTQASVIRAEYDIRVYRDQFAEIERDVERGVLSPTEAEAARIEVQRRLLAADTERQGAVIRKPGTARLHQALAYVVIMAVAGGAGLVYDLLGSPNAPDVPWTPRAAARLGLSPDALEAQIAVANRAEASANDTPKDQARWVALGGLRTGTAQWDKAVAAYQRAISLGPVTEETWTSYGVALVNGGDGSVSADARNAFLKALQMNRSNPQARWYLGVAAADDGKPAEALAIWRDLAQDTPPDAPWASMLQQAMTEIGTNANIAPMSVMPVNPLDLANGTAKVTTAAVPASAPPADPSGALPPGMTPQIMVAQLQARLKASPNDFQGWMMLGRSLEVMKDLPGSIDAYAHAVALQPDDLDAKYGYANGLLFQAEKARALPPPVFFSTVTALQAKAPDAPDTLYLAGIAAAAEKKPDQAKALWGKLRDSLPVGSDMRKTIEAELQALDAPSVPSAAPSASSAAP